MTEDECQNDEKIVYNGMWGKGKQKPDLPIDENAQQELDQFISEKKLGSPHKKHRIGHQNCIPKNS